MKRLRKLLGVVAAIAMTVTMLPGSGIPAYADETTSSTAGSTTPQSYTLTITGTTAGHTLNVYQIMTGDISGNQGENANANGYTLSNAKWSNGATKITIGAVGTTPEKGITILANTSVSDDDMTAISAASADKITFTFGEQYGQSVTTAKDKTEINNLPAGWYVIKDETEANKVPEKEAVAKTVIQVVGNTTIAAKTGTVESDKKVQDQNDSTGESTNDTQKRNLRRDQQLIDSADYDIGDTIPYTITFKLPENYTDYKTYKVSFVDTMSKGLTYAQNSAKIHYGSTDTQGTDITPSTSMISETDATYPGGTKLTWTVDNLKAVDNAKALKEGDLVYITYNATLNGNAVIGSAGNPNKMHVEFSNNPNQGGDKQTGNTPDDTNIVFTYQVVFNKVHVGTDGRNEPLTGADFELFKFIKDDNGTVTYKNADNKEVKGTWTKVTELNSTTHPTKSTTTADGTGATVGKDGTATKFTFKGLDEGTYKLEETVTPAGYNSIQAQIFTITATHDIVSNTPTLTALTSSNTSVLSFSQDPNNIGSLSTDVVNRAGNTLPSTGGIGTTIFYAAGACLAVAAGVILVARKRMSSER